MEWIWNYVFALLTSHSITQMDSCRHGCWAKLVTLSPNNIAITKSHSNYGHIGIFIGAWAWQPKQCPLGESGLGSVPLSHNGPLSTTDITDQVSGWGKMDLLGADHRPRPWPVSAVTPQWRDPDKCPIMFPAVTTIWYESHSTHWPVCGARPPLPLYRVWKIKWETVCHPVHAAWGINRFVIEHILLSVQTQCNKYSMIQI